MATMIQALDYLTLFVPNLEACRHFYRDILGLSELEASPRFVLLSAGNCRLGLHASDDESRCSDAVNLHFRVDDVDGVCALLMQAGAVCEHAPRNRPWGSRAADFRDPAGYAVELVGTLQEGA